MDIESIVSLVCVALAISSGFYVFVINPKGAVNRAYFYTCMGIMTWLLMFFISRNYALPDNYFGHNWYRIAYCGFNFIPLFAFNFIIHFLKMEKYKKWTQFNVLYGLAMCYVILKTNFLISGVRQYPWGTYPAAGPYNAFLLGYMVLLVVFCFKSLLPVVSNKENPQKVRMQANYVLTAFCFLILAAVDIIPSYGIKVYPFGAVPTTFFHLIIAYAIVRHQLMDINAVIQQSIVYSALLTALTFVYLLSIVTFERIFQNFVGYQSMAGSIVITIMIAILFNPMKSYIQNILDRTFFKGTAMEIAAQNEMLRQEITQSERYKTLTSLTSGIIDEIKNPLTALKGYAHFLDQKANDKEFIQKYRGVKKAEIQKINDLLKHLSDYSNPAPLARTSIHIKDFLDKATNLLKSRFLEHKIEVKKEFQAKDDLHLNVDANQLQQALSNIMVNAVEAMPNGGALTIATEEDEDGGNYRIIIRDSGGGVAKENILRLYDPFFTTKPGHTGLGLAITQGIIENHKGKIRVKSEPGEGAEFTIELPLAVG